VTTYLGILVTAFLITHMATPLIQGLAYRVGALDVPSARKIHSRITPRLGGLAVFMGFWGAFGLGLLANPRFRNSFPESVWGLLAGSVLLVAVGIYDDIKGARVWFKLPFQVLAALIAFHYGVRFVLLSDVVHLFTSGVTAIRLSYWSSLILTVLWVVGITNAMNFVDGIDALAGGLSFIVSVTLFIVASKSGGTVETRSHEAHFRGLLKNAGVKNPGRHFCAITDPGSGLEESAKKLRYRKVFLNPSDIGGRYSALSYFGLVPGFFAGVDIRALVDDAVIMQRLLTEREGEANAALTLGSFMAACARAGRDKLTFVASKRTAPLVPWIEQLVAESTGKKKLGVIPIEAEPVGRANLYLKDRVFVFLRMVREKAADQSALADNLSRRGVPVVEMTLGSLAELGGQFLLWEAATGVAGWQLGINPFDEPNVTESKNNTRAILGAFERSGEFPDQKAHGRFGKLSLIACGGCEKYRKTDSQDLTRLLKRFFAGGKPPGYCAFLNYFKADSKTEKLLAQARAVINDRTGMATLRGYGPRYLHSVGQLYKGGPATGRFIVFVRARYGRLEIPGEVYGFGQLIAAQAIGDAQALMSRSLSTLVIAIEGGAAPGLEQFLTALRRAL